MADPSLYLVMASNLGGTVPDKNGPTLVWLARWTNLDVGDSRPATEDGTVASRPPLSYGYVLLGGRTGAVINATFMEAP